MIELEWVYKWLGQLEASLEAVLLGDEMGGWTERTGGNWTYPDDREPECSPYTYKVKEFQVETGQGNVIFEISLFGEGDPAQSIVIDISQVIGSVRQECNYSEDDNIHMAIHQAVQFMLREFARNGKKRYYDSDEISRTFNSSWWKTTQIVEKRERDKENEHGS